MDWLGSDIREGVLVVRGNIGMCVCVRERKKDRVERGGVLSGVG